MHNAFYKLFKNDLFRYQLSFSWHLCCVAITSSVVHKASFGSMQNPCIKFKQHLSKIKIPVMKRFICLLMFLFVSVAIVNAQSAEETKVAEAVTALNKATIEADKNMLESLTAEDLSYGHSGGKVENKTQFITALVSGAVDFISIDITDQKIMVAGKNAIVRNIYAAKLTSEGKPVELKIGTLMVWQKIKGKWKLLARQGYKL